MDKLKEKEVLFIKSKNILIVCLVLVLIFGVGVSFAADTNQADTLHAINNDTAVSASDTDAVSITENLDNALSVSDETGNDKVLSVNNDYGSETLGDGETGSFTDLNKLIKFASDTLTLESDYEFKEGVDDEFGSNGITISKSITINGNGHTINGNSKRVFYVSADNVVITNLNIVNAGTTSINGGSIYWVGNNGNLTYSTFSYITSCYGAVYWLGNNANIINVTFENDTAQRSAGLHSIGDNINVINNTFRNCTLNGGDCWGAAMSIQAISGKTYVIGCNFIECDSSKFRGDNGGILYTQRNSYAIIDRCTFIGNKVRSNHYGFIGDSVMINCTNCYFKDNNAPYISYGRYVIFDNCTFINQSYIGSSSQLFKVNNCRFYNQSSSIILPSSSVGSTISNSNFTNCTIPIQLNSAKFTTIDNCNFIKCTTTYAPIYSNSANYTIIKNCKFDDGTTGGYANAIYITGVSRNNIDDTNIYPTGSTNNVVGNAGTFVVYDELYVKSTGVYTKGNVRVGDDLPWAAQNIFPGGTIYLEKGTYEFTSRYNLYGNIVGNGAIINKGTFYLYQIDIKIENVIFNNSQNSLYFAKVSLTVNNCTFTNFTQTFAVINAADACENHVYSNLILSNINVGSSAAVIYVSEQSNIDNITINELTSSNCIFWGTSIANGAHINNVSVSGATFNYFLSKSDSQQDRMKISNINISDSTIKNCFFPKLTSGWDISVEYVTITGCDFTQNTNDYLFAVQFSTNLDNHIRKQSYSNIHINDLKVSKTFNIFKFDNTIGSWSSLIPGVFNLADSSFSNIETQGYLFSGDFEEYNLNNISLSTTSIPTLISGTTVGTFNKFVFDDVTFTSGTMLTLNDDVSLINSKFTDFTGNVKINGDNVRITNTSFVNGKTVNTNDIAGAIELINGDQAVIQYCNFTNNVAYNGGAIYINNVTNSSYIMNCIFTGNTARNNGGAVYIETGIYYYIDEPTTATIGLTNPYNNLHKEEGVKETEYTVWVSFAGGGDGSYESPCSLVDSLSKVSPYGSIMFKDANSQYIYTTFSTLEFLKPGIKIYGNYSRINNVAFVIDELAYDFEIYNLIIGNVTGSSAVIWNGDNGKIVNCTISDNGGDKIMYGAAIKVNAENLTITNTVFKNNIANNDSYSYGGAIYCNASGLNLKDCTFDTNSVYGWGSHVYLDEDADDVCINGTKFINGLISQGDGSAIYVLCESNVTICNSTFTSNHAVNGGALNVNSNIIGLKIYNNTFTSNVASNNGGAIAFTCSEINYLEMYNNIYTSNSAKYGGAIYSNVGFSESDSTFKSNSATDGSAIYLTGGNALTLTRDTFESNAATGQGTVYIGNGGSINPTDLTFTTNTKTSTDIYFAGDYTAPVLYVTQSGSGSGTIMEEPTTLSNAVSHIASGGRIILLSNISLSAVVAITNKNIALVGNGYTIIRSGSGRAFTITGSTVNIENLTFNSFSTSDCVVYYDSTSSGSVLNTNFTNQASGTSALDIEGNVDVTNCVFKGNTLTSGGALYYGSSATGTVSASTFNNTHNLYLSNVNTITVSGNTFVCPSVTIDAITSPQSYHSTVTISGTFDDGTNRYSKHNVNIKSNDMSINVASLTSSNTYSCSYVNLTNGDYVISVDVVSDGNTYIYDTPTRSFTISPANTIYIGPAATGDGSGVDINNLATWDTIGTRLADSGTVYFTDGNYVLSGKTISKPWTLTASSASNVIVNSSGSSYIFSSTVDNVNIKNLTLYSTGYPIAVGSNVINVENSVLYNQLSVDPFSDPVYGDTITLDCTFIKITPSDLTAYVNGDELVT